MYILNGKILIQPLLDAQIQLNEAIKTAQSRLEITGAIKCFEYCYEMSWKIMRKILIEQGIDENVNSPRSVFRHAHSSGLIDNVQAWNDFIEKRNLTVHTYDGHLADIVFESLPTFADELDLFVLKIKRL
ncbi:nucleotidyltransferase substrate binding protein [Candidatus Dependentiae bacterium]|jgi:nucleotidyltransferase substrate binding protein (TIGR01987 family)|nr:nucleotidyltransferase substrate binding protein [Candidatus Dependentiae bacterium]